RCELGNIVVSVRREKTSAVSGGVQSRPAATLRLAEQWFGGWWPSARATESPARMSWWPSPAEESMQQAPIGVKPVPQIQGLDREVVPHGIGTGKRRQGRESLQRKYAKENGAQQALLARQRPEARAYRLDRAKHFAQCKSS